MKTVPYSDILNQTCQIIGLDTITLNDRSFNAIRDLAARRISQVWDREDWPDTERTMRTFPGIPVVNVSFGTATPTNKTLTLQLSDDFQKVYLANFEGDAYRKGEVAKTKLSLLNPFYITLSNGTKQALSDSYAFTYTESQDYGGNGPYILNVNIPVPLTTASFGTLVTTLPNQALTTTVVFDSNQQLLIQLPDSSLQGLEVYNEDPRQTTRCRPQNFYIDDFNNRDDTTVPGSSQAYYSQEYSYLRVFDSSQKFVKYRIPTVRIFGSKYVQSSSYANGSQVYYGDNFFQAIANVPAGAQPDYVSIYWKAVQIPFRFRDFLINGIAADFMRSEGRADEANIFDQLAETSIQQQIDVLVRQQGQVRKMDMAYTY